MKEEYILDQTSGQIAQYFNDIRLSDLSNKLNELNVDLNEQLTNRDICLANALSKMDKVQEFIEDPSHILGDIPQKHGEIAEQLEIGIQNSKRAMEGLPDIAVNDPNRIGPIDYWIDGNAVQSKFNRNELETLSAVFRHLKNNSNIDFARGNGSFYHIPKDQYEMIESIMNNDFEVTPKNIVSVLNVIKGIEDESGQSFTDIVKQSSATYDEVQLNNIQKTIDNYREELKQQNQQLVDNIKKENAKKQQEEIIKHKPTLKEGAKVAAISAAISGGATLAIDIYKKRKDEKKKISEFDRDDWKEIGLDTGAKTLRGGVTGISVYALTNYAHLSAPSASGLVSATWGVGSLLNDYRLGKITFTDFMYNSETVCMNVSATVIGSTIGQTIIPIPILGSVIGSTVANIITDIAEKQCTASEQKLIDEFYADQQKINTQYQLEYNELTRQLQEHYKSFDILLKEAFDPSINYILRFDNSIKLAEFSGVEDSKILHSIEEANDYFLN